MENKPIRLAWIDWMKSLAIYFIIAGHCIVPGNKYIYVFSVPCFFILSGFLSKKESNSILFWEKLWWNLILPMCLYFIINTLIQFGVQIINGSFKIEYIYQAPLMAAIGMQGQSSEAGGLKAMWFVYTLVLCKILLQYSSLLRRENLLLIILSVICLFCAWLLKFNDIVVYNSFVDLLLAMPFFTMGYLLRPYKSTLSNLSRKWILLLSIIGIVGICICGTYNDIVMLYRCSYGSSILLCLAGAFCGTIFIYCVSNLLQSYLSNYVRIIGGGTLVILGLHFVIIQIINKFTDIHGIWLYLESLVIFVGFIPVIKYIEIHIPVLYGKLRK